VSPLSAKSILLDRGTFKTILKAKFIGEIKIDEIMKF
jgi:hypothetical protein